MCSYSTYCRCLSNGVRARQICIKDLSQNGKRFNGPPEGHRQMRKRYIQIPIGNQFPSLSGVKKFASKLSQNGNELYRNRDYLTTVTKCKNPTSLRYDVNRAETEYVCRYKTASKQSELFENFKFISLAKIGQEFPSAVGCVSK